MQIDHTAPLTARKDIFINAPPEKIWAVQSDINHWSDWQPGIASARLEGDLAEGTTFRWKAMGMGITSVLRDVQPPRRIAWTGDSLGMKAHHIWIFEPEGGGTRVTTEESLSGWLARLLKLFDKNFLEKSLEKSLQTLKNRVEQP